MTYAKMRTHYPHEDNHDIVAGIGRPGDEDEEGGVHYDDNDDVNIAGTGDDKDDTGIGPGDDKDDALGQEQDVGLGKEQDVGGTTSSRNSIHNI